MYLKTERSDMLELEYRVTHLSTWDYPEEGYHIIHADFEIDIEEIIEENDLDAEDLALHTLKYFLECEGNIDAYYWCDVEFGDKTVMLDTIWHLTLGELRCEKLYFLETEN